MGTRRIPGVPCAGCAPPTGSGLSPTWWRYWRRETGKEIGGLEVETFRTVHTETASATRYKQGKEDSLHGGHGLLPRASGHGVGSGPVRHGMWLPDSERMKVHMTPSDIAEILRGSSPSKMVLSHLYSSMDGRNLAEEIKALSENRETEIITAEDLMEIVP